MAKPATEITQSVTDLLQSEFSDTDVELQYIPIEYKNRLPARKVTVAWNNKESHEVDRSNEALFYSVAIGIYQPMENTTDIAEQKACIDFVEEIQDALSLKSNRTLTLATLGEAKLQLPFTTDQLVDPVEVKSTSNFFSVISFKYRYFKGRA